MELFAKNLKKLRVSKGFSQADIASKLAVKNGTISNYENSVSSPDLGMLTKLSKILETSTDQLLGIDTFQQSVVNEVATPYLTAQKGVPYFDVDFKGGFDLVFNNQNITPAFHINYPPFKEADCWVNITGGSMAPQICHGDLVALQRIENKSWQEFLLLGEVYAIVCDDFRTIKVIAQGKDDKHFNLVPYSKEVEFSEQQIPKKLIKQMFKVLGSIKKFF